MDQLPDDHVETDLDADSDATDEQIAELRRLGIGDEELEALTFQEAEEWIDELRAQRQDAGKWRSS